MPLSAANTEAALDAQPTQTQNPTVVTVELKFVGVNFVPGALYDALNTAYGTVATDKDTMTRGAYQFTITP